MSRQGSADAPDDRVKLPSDPTRTVKGVDVLPYVLSPLMGPEEYDIDVSLPLVLIQKNKCGILTKFRKWRNCLLRCNS